MGRFLAAIQGVPEFERPVVDITSTMSTWEQMGVVTRELKKRGLSQAAQEFRQLYDECEGDSGMLFTMALIFIRIPGQEEV